MLEHESGTRELWDRDEPLNVFVDLRFIGFVCPL